MCENNQKKQYNSYNPAIMKKLKEKYGFSVQFIGQSLRGERTSDMSIKICEEYKQMQSEINKIINRA